ncbi:hypothetical protein BC828DRAFT_343733 [Blastocladiella britannica]|nr:hypothetical protein BC828DRAFT_343733 [Blastocladiella britannica]
MCPWPHLPLVGFKYKYLNDINIIYTAQQPRLLFGKKGRPIVIQPDTNPPSNTLYIRCLPERIGHTTLQRLLMRLYEQYGRLLEVRCHHGMRKRGQAWVTFYRTADAEIAYRDTQDHKFMGGKPMIVHFAKMKAKALAEHDGPDALHAYEVAHAKRFGILLFSLSLFDCGPTAPAHAAALAAVPDDLAPPNPTLFVQGIDADVTDEVLRAAFSQYPGLVEIRRVQSKGVAFIEYESVAASTEAKKALHGVPLGAAGTELKVFFRK